MFLTEMILGFFAFIFYITDFEAYLIITEPIYYAWNSNLDTSFSAFKVVKDSLAMSQNHIVALKNYTWLDVLH